MTTTSPAAIKAAYAKNCIQNIEICNICNVHSEAVRTQLQNIAVCNMTAKSEAPAPATTSKRDDDNKSSDLMSKLSAMMITVIAAALSIERAVNGVSPNSAEYYVFYGMVLIALTASLLTIKLAEK